MTDTIYVMSGGSFFNAAFNGVAALFRTSTWDTLFSIVGFFSAMVLFWFYVRSNDPKEVVKFIAVFLFITSVLIIPKRTVHIVDLTNPASVYRVDNVPAGLAIPFRFVTSFGASLTKAFELVFHTPDSVTYSKTGMLFGANLMANTTDMMSQNGHLSQLFGEYVKQCVIGDIMLTTKYTMQELMHSTNPYELIFRKPSPLRGVIVPYGNNLTGPGFQTCEELAKNVLKPAMEVETRQGGKTWDYYVKRLFGTRASAHSLFSQMMADSYGFYYQGGRSASEIMRQNVTMSALRQGITSHSAASGNAASLVNLANVSSASKMRLSQAAAGGLSSTFTPVMHTVLMAMLVGMFPIIILLAAMHSLTIPVLKGYVLSIVYLQSWPPLYALLNYAMSFYLRGETTGLNFTLASTGSIQQTHSDIGLMAAWLSNAIPFIAAGLVFGLWRVVSQAGNYLGSSINSNASSAAAQATDGSWSFNNMQMDNVSGHKWDTNQSFRNGQMTTQHASGATTTKAQDGSLIHDARSGVSNLATDIQFGKMLSSGYQAQQREAESQVRSLSRGISHSSQLAGSQLSQWAQQRGNSDTFTQGADSSLATSQGQALSKLDSVVKAYAQQNGLSYSDSLAEVMSKSQAMNVGAGARGYADVATDKQIIGKLARLGTGWSVGGQAHVEMGYTGSNGSSHSLSSDLANQSRNSQDLTAQQAKDVRESMDIINSTRATDSGSSTQNTSGSLSSQVSSSLSELQSQIRQYNDALNRSSEYAQMASYAENNSANINSNYSQEFVRYAHAMAPGRATAMLTDSADPQLRAEREQLAQQFVDEKLKPQLEQTYRENLTRTSEGMGDVSAPSGMAGDLQQQHRAGTATMNRMAGEAGVQSAEHIGQQVSDVRQKVATSATETGQKMAEYGDNIGQERTKLSQEYQDKSGQFEQAKVSEQKRQDFPIGDNFNASDKLDDIKNKMKDINPFKDDK
ncbi:conjugal transfer protein TraG [Salmonella enterica subsp. enterica serovar Brandenburg]|nr:conjugal transfer protein TraG [Salmonella enterica subsp. enterica serovar Brandenburg]